MKGFFNLLASGARSLSFERRLNLSYRKHKDYERRVMPIEPRTPQEILRSAWEDVGNRMWEAMGAIEKEYGQQIAK
jgi:hypothetical protein